MSTQINDRDGFFAKLEARGKVVPVELPDMGATVHILKGTWKIVRAIRTLKDEDIPGQVAQILCNAEGTRIITAEADIEKLNELMSVADLQFILKRWNEINEAKIDDTIKN